MTRMRGTRAARSIVLALVFAVSFLASAAQATADDSQRRHPPRPHHHVGAHHKPATAHHKPATAHHKPATAHHRPATAGDKPATAGDKPAAARAEANKPSHGSPISTATRSSGNAKAQGAGRPTVNPAFTRRGTSSAAATPTSSATSQTPTGTAPAATPTRTAPAATPSGAGSAGGAAIRGSNGASGPSLGIAPMNGALLLPGDEDGAPGSDRSQGSDSNPLGVNLVPGRGMSGLDDAAIIGLLLGTFVIALTATVIVAGHRGRRTS